MPPDQSSMEYHMSTTGAERREYAEWKRERDEIDRQRLNRQKKPDGQWKREWDAAKTAPFEYVLIHCLKFWLIWFLKGED